MILLILVIFSVISFLTNIFLYFSLLKALNAIDKLENNIKELDEYNSEILNWVVDFKNLVNNVYKKLKLIDDRGIFAKDDDVGFLFQDMLNIVDECNKRIKGNDNDNIQITDEKKN